MTLAIHDFPAGGASEGLRPLASADHLFHHEALGRGELLLQRCQACLSFRHPFGPLCPWCDSREHGWQACPGRGVVHSWARYHKAFVPQFESLLPYVVLAVRLDEGPVLMGRLVGSSEAPAIGAAVQAVVERWRDGFCGLGFRIEGERA